MSLTIYALCCPTTGRARYIGRTHDLAKRLQNHRHSPHSARLRQWLRSIKGQVLVRTLLQVEDEEGDRAERAVLAAFRRRGEADLNCADGGIAGVPLARKATVCTRLANLPRPRTHQRLYQLRCVAERRCPHCGTPLTGSAKYCVAALTRRREYKYRRRAAGLPHSVA